MYYNTSAAEENDGDDTATAATTSPFQSVQYAAQVYFSQCLWWDEDALAGEGDWSASGCQVRVNC